MIQGSVVRAVALLCCSVFACGIGESPRPGPREHLVGTKARCGDSPGDECNAPSLGALYDCGDGATATTCDLSVRSRNAYPTRLAWGAGARLYVTDALSDALFIYDTNLKLTGQLSGLDRPLGVAVGPRGFIYVGNDGRDNVEVYSTAGARVAVIDDGNIKKPNAIAIAADGSVYVADSIANVVKVYSADRVWQFDISGTPALALRFPAALAIVGDELYVADQGHALVRVFDLDGHSLRMFGGKPERGVSEGRFTKIQSLAVDEAGMLHVLDSFASNVQILDPADGHFIATYGGFGTARGQLNLPLDIAIAADDRVVVANAENHRVEVVHHVGP